MPSEMSAPVLQVISSTARRGAEVFAVELAEALRARGRDVETVALTSARSPGDLDVPVLGENSLAPSTLRALLRKVASSSIVVSHGSRSLPASFVAMVGTQRRLVYRSIGDAVTYASTPARRARVALYLRRATAVVVLWPDAAQLLSRRYRIPLEKIRVIPNGVPAATFAFVDRGRRAAARQRLGLDEDGSVALFLGALVPEKGPQVAVDAVASVPRLRLVIAGDGPERARLEEHARERLPGRALFTGRVEDPASVLAAADVLVLPSRTEGMPAVAIEAGLSGLPVVATDVGATREVVIDEQSGILVPLGDTRALATGLRRALAEADEMGRRGREHCLRRFEIGVISDAWDQMLEQLERVTGYPQ